MSILHETARAYAQSGVPVFPCRANEKTPACPHGYQDATCDLEQIDRWWADNPNYNVALCPDAAGWYVVDIEASGEAAWNTFADPTPETYTVRTPRGGRHLYFEGSLPSTVRKLFPGEGIDTRGIGGYVLVPPSIVDGKPYVEIDGRDVAAGPLWIATSLTQRNLKARAAVSDLDTPGNVARAISHIDFERSGGRIAIAGRGGNNLTYAFACEIIDLGLTPGKAFELLRDRWNRSCIPPWSDEELETIVGNAARYLQNEPGAKAIPSGAELWAEAAKSHVEISPKIVEKRSRFYPEDEEEQDTGKEPTWLIENVIPEQSTCLMIGPTGAYKSFLALDMCLSVSTGTETFGALPRIGPTVYAALEGRANLKKKRRNAWKLVHSLNRVSDFYVNVAPMIGVPGEVQEFGDEIAKRLKGRRPKLIVLDTLAKCMAGLNENDASEAGKFIRFCDSLVEAFGCSVIAIHHTGKDDSRGARGSSAFYAGFDTVIEVKAQRETKAVEVWVRKHKDAEEPERPWTFEGRAVAGSLVFSPTTAEIHSRNTSAADTFQPSKIGQALRALAAIDQASSVVGTVLAQSLITPLLNETVEQRQRAINAAERTLARLARTTLRAYCEGTGSSRRWFIPSGESR